MLGGVSHLDIYIRRFWIRRNPSPPASTRMAADCLFKLVIMYWYLLEPADPQNGYSFRVILKWSILVRSTNWDILRGGGGGCFAFSKIIKEWKENSCSIGGPIHMFTPPKSFNVVLYYTIDLLFHHRHRPSKFVVLWKRAFDAFHEILSMKKRSLERNWYRGSHCLAFQIEGCS